MAGKTLLSILVSLGLKTDDFDKGIDKAEGKAKQLQGNLAKIGGAAVAGGIAAVGAGVAFLGTTIGPASDLAETVSKVGVVFGETAPQILEMGKNAAVSMGMSENAALAAAGTYGNLFRAMGIGEQTSADMSGSLVGLAADLASFNNMDPTEVLDKLRAGLSGETEPLKSLGVNLNAAEIEARALKMGLKKVNGVLPAAAKAQASYALIMEQTALAQGDFARTSEGLANQQRIMKAQFENVKATLGTALLPLMTTLAGILNSIFTNPAFQTWLNTAVTALTNFAQTVVAWIPQIIAWFQQAFGWLAANQGVVVGVLAAIGVAIAAFVFTTVVPALVAFITAAAPVIAVMALVGAAAYLLYQAWTTNFGGIQEKAAAVWAAIQPVFATLVQWLQTNIPAAVAILVGFWNNTLYPALQKVWSWMSAVLFPFLAKLGELIGTVISLAVTVLAGIFQNVLIPAITKLIDWVRPAVEWIGGKLAPAFDWVSTAIQNVTKWLGTLIDALKNIKLPDWMTPGSPTPWETGLVGIANAMDKLSTASLPRLEMGLDMGTPAGVNAAGGGMGGGATFGDVTINVNGASNPKETAQEVARVLGKMAAGKMASGAAASGGL
mgnify:CR=1 FL=1